MAIYLAALNSEFLSCFEIVLYKTEVDAGFSVFSLFPIRNSVFIRKGDLCRINS